MSDVTAPKAAKGEDARGGSGDDAPVAAPALRFVTGHPTDEEVAAVQVVISALAAERAARGAERVAPPVDLWRRSARAMRGPLTAGPGRWNESRGMRG